MKIKDQKVKESRYKGGTTMRIKKMLTTAIITAAVAVTAMALNPVEAQAATGWNKNNTSWWWENADGSYPANAWKQVGSTWYYFDGSGYMVTGWQKINGTWYYMDNSGAMVTGWQKINGTWYYMDNSGAMLTGWQQINGTWYYMYDSGAMASDTYIDSYYVDASGAWITDTSATASSFGWIKDNTGWWYRHEDGSYTRNGWEKIDKQWYYFNASGYMHIGWLKSGKYWYYLQPSGAMAKNMYIGDNYVDMSGKWLTGAEKDKYLQALAVAQEIANSIPKYETSSDSARVAAAAWKVSQYCNKGTYTTEGSDYYTAYGVFISGEYSCAGATRALGMVLECMGYEWEHVNENQWTHQWCKLEMDGRIGWADGQMGGAGYGERMIN